jgi:hypothetical protein
MDVVVERGKYASGESAIGCKEEEEGREEEEVGVEAEAIERVDRWKSEE